MLVFAKGHITVYYTALTLAQLTELGQHGSHMVHTLVSMTLLQLRWPLCLHWH